MNNEKLIKHVQMQSFISVIPYHFCLNWKSLFAEGWRNYTIHLQLSTLIRHWLVAYFTENTSETL